MKKIEDGIDQTIPWRRNVRCECNNSLHKFDTCGALWEVGEEDLIVWYIDRPYGGFEYEEACFGFYCPNCHARIRLYDVPSRIENRLIAKYHEEQESKKLHVKFKKFILKHVHAIFG